MRYSLCNHWEFTEQWSDAFCRGEPVGCRPVRLPHTCRELPLHYADPSDYEMVCGYRRTLTVPDAPRVFLRFDGAAHQAEIYLNGQLAGQHQGGYTGFTIEITDLCTAAKKICWPCGWIRARIPACRLRLCHRLPDLRRSIPGGLA